MTSPAHDMTSRAHDMTSACHDMTVGAHALLAGLQQTTYPRDAHSEASPNALLGKVPIAGPLSQARNAPPASDLSYHGACPPYCR